ncbi:MAG: DUF3368 domain-containing protein [Ardenticatenaceae bacterium]|nr:DUF3368 domain-containing protein [Ardenticatenaceae bacterium]
MIALLDNTVLSNFALVKRLPLLVQVFGKHLATTPYVVQEYEDGVRRGRVPPISFDWIAVLPLTRDELTQMTHLQQQVDAGEASCLAVALGRQGIVLSDDRNARQVAGQIGVAISGTLGVLVRLIKVGVLSLEEANRLLAQMIVYGYRSPVETLEQLIK